MNNIIPNDKVERFKATIKKEKDILGKKLSPRTEIEVYIQSIYLGYLDAARTFKGQRKITKDDSEIYDIANTMKSYINCTVENFDSMFYGTCEKLCNKYKMKFGQAQKIINMAFKYLYCIADDDLKGRFSKCHLPLDGIMLEWINRNIKDDEEKAVKKIDAWSQIEKGSENKACTYMYYKKYIDKYCRENETTPLQLDFEHWVEMSQTLAAENYKKTFTEDELKKEMHITLLKR